MLRSHLKLITDKLHGGKKERIKPGTTIKKLFPARRKVEGQVATFEKIATVSPHVFYPYDLELYFNIPPWKLKVSMFDVIWSQIKLPPCLNLSHAKYIHAHYLSSVAQAFKRELQGTEGLMPTTQGYTEDYQIYGPKYPGYSSKSDWGGLAVECSVPLVS